MASTGQPGEQAQATWVSEGQVLFDQPDFLLLPVDPPSG